MRKANSRFVARSFRRTSNRKLTLKELSVLEFLWTWKAASTPMLKEVAFKCESHWWVYRALRRLKQEKYIQLLPRGRNLDLELWALTKHGFEVVLMDRDDIDQYRYRIHAPAHDYLATCLQLGNLWKAKVDAQFFSEQMLSSLSKWNFPKDVVADDGHIPDGVTILGRGKTQIRIGYEVDLNLKDEERYQKTVRYYLDCLKPQVVVWLIKFDWMYEKIWSVICDQSYGYPKADLAKQYAFVSVEDFKQAGWNAQISTGPQRGTSLHKLHANLLQSQGQSGANLLQNSAAEIFFPRFKSPQKSIASLKCSSHAKLLTPYGSRGEIKNPSGEIVEASSNQNQTVDSEVIHE